MRSYDFVEMYKENKHLPSDYRAAKELGVSRAMISLFKGGRPLNEEIALKIADELGIEPSEILVVVAAEKSKSEEAKKAFMSLSKLQKQAGRATANLLFPLSFFAFAVQYCILC